MTKTNLTDTIDALGMIKAEIADLKLTEDKLKAAIADLPVGNYEGERYRLCVTAPEREKPSDELKTRQKEAIEAFRATLSHQYLTAHAPMVAVPTLTVRARTGVKVAA